MKEATRRWLVRLAVVFSILLVSLPIEFYLRRSLPLNSEPWSDVWLLRNYGVNVVRFMSIFFFLWWYEHLKKTPREVESSE